MLHLHIRHIVVKRPWIYVEYELRHLLMKRHELRSNFLQSDFFTGIAKSRIILQIINILEYSPQLFSPLWARMHIW